MFTVKLSSIFYSLHTREIENLYVVEYFLERLWLGLLEYKNSVFIKKKYQFFLSIIELFDFDIRNSSSSVIKCLSVNNYFVVCFYLNLPLLNFTKLTGCRILPLDNNYFVDRFKFPFLNLTNIIRSKMLSSCQIQFC